MRSVLVASAILLAGVPFLMPGQAPEPADNVELRDLFEKDQADRRIPAAEIDWVVVSARDQARQARVMELYHANALQTGADWFHAALILQHGPTPDDHILAHEMCIAALALGDPRAVWLAAATEDRFLRGIGRKQRFGTQYESSGPGAPMLLADVEEGVTDALRHALKVPPLPAPASELDGGS